MLHNRRNLRRNRQASASGMTLLELILALALSGLLLMAISMALHIHWKAFDVRRSRIEDAQLARAILRNIGDDIRGTLKNEPLDLSGMNLTSLAAGLVPGLGGGTGSGDDTSGGESSGDGSGGGAGNGSGSAGGGGGGTGAGGSGSGGSNPSPPSTGGNQSGGAPSQGSGGAGASGSGGSSTGGASTGGGSSSAAGNSGSQDSSGSDSGASTESTTPSVTVGLYGTATQLQFDISRLPRVDQYALQESQDGSIQIPSDIKTVVYFLQSDDALSDGSSLSMATTAQPSTTGTGRGLMRAESDRAVSAWGEMNGSAESLYSGARLLAKEVTAVQFQYFDGTEWLTEWNSDDQGGLPVAIEVVLTMDVSASSVSTPLASTTTTAADPLAANGANQRTYRMLVHLPVGGLNQSATGTESESMEATDSGSAGTDASGTDGGTMP